MSIFILGDAWSAHDEKTALPFSGPNGWLLDELLRYAGIERHKCVISNVFNLNPGYDISNFGGPRHDSLPAFSGTQNRRSLRAEFYPELRRVESEIISANPNLILALGGVALWALTGEYKISKHRGTVGLTNDSVLALPPRKYLATHHPAAIFRDYSLKPVAFLDFKKAKKHSVSPDFTRPSRKIYIPESMYDLEIIRNKLRAAPKLSVDIETQARQITCIGFAPDANSAYVIPITKGSGSFWSEPQELYAWKLIREILLFPSQKIFQNGMYDLKFLWEIYGIPVANAGEDTMLLHHAIYLESEKSLGFMGSVYTDEPSWKTMRSRAIGTIKKED